MDLADGIQQLIPPGPYEVNAIDVEYFRVLRSVRCPNSSPVPSVAPLQLSQTPESYFLAIDSQIYIPEQQTIILNIKLEENNLAFTRVAHWAEKLWYFAAILDMHPDPHPLERWGWNLGTFQRLLDKSDFECVESLDRGCHWVHVSR